jgi:HEAT repeat protein
MSFRQLKKEVFDLLAGDDFPEALFRLSRLPGKQVVNPLFSFLHHTDETVRWHAVSAMGAVIAGLAHESMESARVVVRRLIWNLNDESGGIGWGSPEALGDIMARSNALAREFSKILVSYVMPHGNFLEHGSLQRGVLWGLHRLGETNAGLALPAAAFVRPFLRSDDPFHRGLAARFAGAVSDSGALPHLEKLLRDDTRITLYSDYRMISHNVANLAAEAIAAIGRQ